VGSNDKWAKTSSFACWVSAIIILFEPNHLMRGQSIFGPKKWASTMCQPGTVLLFVDQFRTKAWFLVGWLLYLGL
jgi:hypothetical protein